MTGYKAEVVADSISPDGVRLVTILTSYPRFIHAEVLRHRTFCLAGDMRLDFDLPSGQRGYRKVHNMMIKDFVEKWLDGAKPIPSRQRLEIDWSRINDDQEYTTPQLAYAAGYSSSMNLNKACRDGSLVAYKKDGYKTWFVRGEDFKTWRNRDKVLNRMPMRERLSRMNIRQLDEVTGKIITSKVINCCRSGSKIVYEVKAGKFTLAGSLDHLVMTDEGYIKIRDLVPGRTKIIICHRGKFDSELLDRNRLMKVDGRWRVHFQRQIVKEHEDAGGVCEKCGSNNKLQSHHIIPVHVDISQTYDRDNIIVICKSCHDIEHEVQGWQGGTYLYGDTIVVDSVEERGLEETYDLEIAGEWSNYLANGVVVHNSHSVASSRAIPTERLIEQVANNPFVPETFNRRVKGMGVGEPLDIGYEQDRARYIWMKSAQETINCAIQLNELGVDKSRVNRLLEPYLFVTDLITATEWSNFFALRDHPDAQPELQKIARMMRKAMDESEPQYLEYGWWHLPFVTKEELSVLCDAREQEQSWKMASAGRCARVSYDRQGEKEDLWNSVIRAERLIESGHMSPLEHIATPIDPTVGHDHGKWILHGFNPDGVLDDEIEVVDGINRLAANTFVNNFRGWVQMRAEIPNQHDFSRILAEREPVR